MGGIGDQGGAVERGTGKIIPAPSSNTTPASSGSSVGLSTEYEADRPQVMPVYNSPSQIESARRKRMELMARSGRTSTNLRGNPGTSTYQNSFLGNVA